MNPVAHKFSVEDYHRMGEAGILSPDQRFELIHGEIITRSPVGFKHAATVKRIAAFCHQTFKAVISIHDPIQLNENSEPEPDVALLKFTEDFYDDRSPEARDVLLIIEVSDSTLKYDRETKLPLYAANQIPECWIVNLGDRQLEIYRDPTPSGYQQQLTLKDTETVSPQSFPDVAIAVTELLG
jgi:Uma2 family endonuclease